MFRRNTQALNEVIRDFFEDNTELYDRILQIRIQRAWGEVLGPTIRDYTQQVFIKHRTLYVSITSAVLRSELLLCKDRLVKSLNDYAGATVIDEIVIR